MASTSSAPDTDEAAPAGLGSRLGILAIGSALFVQFADSTALVTALPTLGREFGVGPAHLRIVLTSYMLVQAVCLPAAGWIADRFGARRVFVTAMLIFMAGSALSAMSHSLNEMVAGRMVQGLGASLMTPVGRIMVIASSPKRDLVKAMMYFGMPVMLAPILGPPLAGLILEVADWPWIFWINIPIGLLGVLGVMRFTPRITRPHPGRFDVVGFLIVAVGVSSVLTLAQSAGADSVLVVVSAVLAAGAAYAYLAHSRRRAADGARPLLDLELLRLHTLRASIGGGSLVRLTAGASPYLLTLLLQSALHWSAFHAGMVSTASALGAIMARPGAPALIRKLGFRWLLFGTAILVAVLCAAPLGFREATPVALILAVLFLGGLAQSAQLNAVNALAYADVASPDISSASILAAVCQQISLSLGVTIGGVLLQLSHSAAAPLTPEAFFLPFLTIGLLAVGSAAVYWRMPANAGAEISGR